MSVTDTLYQVVYYARDLTAMTALCASSVLLIMGFFRTSRGLGLRNTATAVGALALIVATGLSAVPMDMALFLSRLSAVEVLVASLVVWLFSLVIQGYYGS